jgi:hypothetical protein
VIRGNEFSGVDSEVGIIVIIHLFVKLNESKTKVTAWLLGVGGTEVGWALASGVAGSRAQAVLPSLVSGLCRAGETSRLWWCLPQHCQSPGRPHQSSVGHLGRGGGRAS